MKTQTAQKSTPKHKKNHHKNNCSEQLQIHMNSAS